MTDLDPAGQPLVAGAGPKVVMVSGLEMTVLNDDEASWFTQTRDNYLSENKFTEAADLRDLDRLLLLELMIYRWTLWQAAGVDYEGHLIEDTSLQRSMKEYGDQINKIKLSLGINKAARTAALNDGNFATYLVDLKARAKAFGIHRETQLREALVLMNEVTAAVGSFLRSDEEERTKLGFQTAEEVLEWIMDEIKPRYDAVDEHFRQNEQRYWVRDL